MSAVAGSGTTGSKRSSDNRGQKILLAVLVVAFIVLLVIQGPKLLDGGSSEPETAVPAASEVDDAAAAAAATQAVTGQPAAGAGAATSAATATPAERRRELRLERYIKSLPARDPFAPVISASAASETSSTPPPVETAPATPSAPAVPPTAAVIWTNGKRQVVGIREVFRVGNASFRLIAVDGATATVAVVGGTFSEGDRRITLDRQRRVTLEDTATGVRYILRFSQPMAIVPEASSSG